MKTQMDHQKLLQEANMTQEGHFILSSGKHSSHYMQACNILSKPGLTTKIAQCMIDRIHDKKSIDGVVAPAMGAVVIGYEISRLLCVPFLFAERTVGRTFLFRRNFSPQKAARYLIVEDIMTTGNSAREIITLLKDYSALAFAVASIIMRANIDFPCPSIYFSRSDYPIWDEKDVPEHIKKIPAVYLGSRNWDEKDVHEHIKNPPPS